MSLQSAASKAHAIELPSLNLKTSFLLSANVSNPDEAFFKPREVRRKLHNERVIARQALALARATRSALKAEQQAGVKRMDEVEELLCILRLKQKALDEQLDEAEQQVGVVRSYLGHRGFPEVSLSDNESGFISAFVSNSPGNDDDDDDNDEVDEVEDDPKSQ